MFSDSHMRNCMKKFERSRLTYRVIKKKDKHTYIQTNKKQAEHR